MCAQQPAAPLRKFSGRSMRRIRAGFGAHRPGSERYSQWGPWESWIGKLGKEEKRGENANLELPEARTRTPVAVPFDTLSRDTATDKLGFYHYRKREDAGSPARVLPHAPPCLFLRAKREVVLYVEEGRTTKGPLCLCVCLGSS